MLSLNSFVDLEDTSDYDESYSVEKEDMNSIMQNSCCYRYCILDYLQIDSEKKITSGYSSYTYIYRINTAGCIPFLQFYFSTDENADFPLCEEKGFFIETAHKAYHTLYEITQDALTMLDGSWKSYTVDEIINKNKINQTVKRCMLRNNMLLILKNKNGDVLETPTVSYFKKNKVMTYKSSPYHIMGPYYYFESEERKDSIRVALFLGKLYVPMNFPNDAWDNSMTKKDILKKYDDSNKYYRQTMRISDHAGKWTTAHDSVYLGKIELDDGTILHENSMWVVKNINQIVVLDE